MTANPLRGEVSITLEGADYVMRPTYEAITAIEEQTGRSIMQLAVAAKGSDLLLREIAIVATECIKAWGRAEKRSDTPNFQAGRVAELIHAEGLLKAMPRVDLVLTQALTGGHKPGEANAAGTTT